MRTPVPDHGQHRQASSTRIWSGNPRRVDDLDINTSEDGCIISRPGKERIHFLNPTAVLILELCNGKNSPEQIVDLVQQAYNLAEPPVEDVRQALKQLKAEDLLL